MNTAILATVVDIGLIPKKEDKENEKEGKKKKEFKFFIIIKQESSTSFQGKKYLELRYRILKLNEHNLKVGDKILASGFLWGESEFGTGINEPDITKIG